MDVRDIIHFEDGGIRAENKGKGLYSCMSMVGLRRLSHRYEYGARKYKASDDYKKGLPTSHCFDSAMRHLVSYMMGDNSEDHLAAVAWNVFCIMEMEENNPKWQDIPTRQQFTKEDFNYSKGEIV